MTEQDFHDRLRLLLRDPEKRIWSDVEVKAALADGKREYCRRVPLLVGSLPILPDRTGSFLWPADFARFQYGVNREEELIACATGARLKPYLGMEGEPVFILDSGETRYRLFPAPDVDGLDIEFVKLDPEYGKIIHDNSEADYTIYYDGNDIARLSPWYELRHDREYGVIRAWEGAWSNSEYGLIREISIGEPVGELRYWRIADDEEWELDSPLGSVYYAAYLLLSSETDRKDAAVAGIMLEMFNRECHEFAHRQIRAGRTIENGEFY